ncbi:MAG: short-chain fatty acid transporter, partial [Bacteroidales bacterium]|nr:short-chain fatty acid transporter [Bacteroidales bacterium]
MFKKLINLSVRLVQRYLPEPFIFAVLLTFVAFAVAVPLCRQTPLEVVENWGNGVWSLLAFSMQMALVLICGAVLAESPSVRKLISTLASLPKSPAGAITYVSLISSLACWINWGFGLIVGVIFAKEIAKKVTNVDYRLLIASSYSGFVVWHSGLSGSIPLTMATEGEALSSATKGIITAPISISSTIFNPYNLLIVCLII